MNYVFCLNVNLIRTIRLLKLNKFIYNIDHHSLMNSSIDIFEDYLLSDKLVLVTNFYYAFILNLKAFMLNLSALF